MDIDALQETRLPETGSVSERDFTLFWQGKPSDDVREHGVGFAVRNRSLESITPPAEGIERILSLRLQTSSGPVSLISAYAPSLASTAEAKEKFYDDLSVAIRRIPDRELLFIAGDFKARVGVDHNSWPTCLGQFSIGKMNENGQRLLELCCHHELCVSNAFFNTKPQHRVSWRHPRSKQWHQFDLILNRRALQHQDNSQLPDTDHSLVCSKVKLRAKSLLRTRKEGRPRMDTSKIRDQRKVEFTRVFEDPLPGPPTANAQGRWEHSRDVAYNAATSTFGKKTNKSADWFEAHSEEMTPGIEAKRNALTAYKTNPSEQNLQILLAAPSKVQQHARQCATGYWLQLCSQIHIAADTGNIKTMYDGIKQALGPTQKKTALMKSATGEVIQDREQQMER